MKERLITILFFFAIIAANFYFGFHRLDSFSGVDEPLWAYDRVPQFWNAVEHLKWNSTTLCDKPGITLAAISGIGLPFVREDPEDLEKLRYAPKTPEQLEALNNLYFSLRLPVFLFALSMLGAFYWLIRRLLGKNIARFSLLFIGLSPILLGISLMINTDAILWNLLPLTLLSFLVYQKENNRKFLYLSGFLLGLTLIDKYIGNILFPFFLGLIFFKYVISSDAPRAADYFKKAFADFGLLVLISAVTIFAFYPNSWIKPKTLLDVTIFSKAFYHTWRIFFALVILIAADTYLLKSRILGTLSDHFKKHKQWLQDGVYGVAYALIAFVLVNTYSGMKLFDFQPVYNFPTLELENINQRFSEPLAIILSSFFPLIFSLLPVLAILFLFAVIVSGVRRMEKKYSIYVSYLLLFMLFYYFGSAFSGVSPTVRYQIVLYPLASIIAAIGLNHLFEKEFLKKYFSSAGLSYVLALLIFIASVLSLRSIQPFYFSYASGLLPQKYVLNLRDMGDGSWEAAQYLNQLPDANNLKIWSDKGGVCEAFVGACSDSLKLSELKTEFDYFVITAGRKAKSLHMGTERFAKFNGSIEIDELYSDANVSQFRLDIGGRKRNYVKVISADVFR